MPSLLNIFDDPNIMSNLLGFNTQGNAAASGQGNENQTANAAQNAQTIAPVAPPPQVMQGGAMGSPTPIATQSFGPPGAGGGPGPGPVPLPPTQVPGWNQSFNANANGGQMFPPGAPMPAPRPAAAGSGDIDATDINLNAGSGGAGLGEPWSPTNNAIEADAGIKMPPRTIPSSQINGNPAGPPGLAPTGQMAPGTATSGGLASMLGIAPNTWQSAMAGLGKGLANYGNSRGANAGQAFALGMGGNLQGTIANQDKQQQEARQAKNDLFNQSSESFKQWIAAQQLNNQTAATQARAKYYDAWAQQRQAGGGKDAYMGTPYEKARDLERMLDTWEQREVGKVKYNAQQQALTGAPIPPDQLAAQINAISTTGRQQERIRRAQNLGIDPNTYLKGTSKNDAYDWQSLTPAQRQQMPDGSYYKYSSPKDPNADKDGNVYKQRDWLAQPPYQGWKPPGEPAVAPSQQGPNPLQAEYEDQMSGVPG